MVNNTVNGKKIGKAAGQNDRTIITATAIKQKEKNLDAISIISKPTIMHAGQFVTIKAYPGGNPNKEVRNSEEMTH